MPASADRLNIAEWEAELAQRRTVAAERPSAEERAALRQEFQRLSQCAKAQNQSPQLGPNGIPALNEFRKPALELMLLAHQELAAFEQSDKPTVPADCVEYMLSEIAGDLAELDAHLELIQSAKLTADLAAPVIHELVSGREVPARRFRPVLEHLLNEPMPKELVALTPLSAIRWDAAEFRLQHLPPWFLATSIPAARWVAVLTRYRNPLTPHLREAQIIAALLADLGQLFLSPASERRRILSPAEYQRHTEISAALIAGMPDAAAEWSVLAGRHHERLDGTGFPRQIAERQLCFSARHLTAVVRWTELLKSKAAVSASLDAIAAAAVTLWKETLVGGFDAAIVKEILAAVRSDLPAAVQRAVLQGSTLKLDAAHTRVPRPHLPLMRHVAKFSREVVVLTDHPRELDPANDVVAEASNPREPALKQASLAVPPPTSTTENSRQQAPAAVIVRADAGTHWRASADNLPRHAAPPRPAVPDEQVAR